MRKMPWVCVLVAAAVAPRAGAENLIVNGGFERPAETDFLAKLTPADRAFYGGAKASPFEGWRFGGGWEGGQYTADVSDEAHSGKRSCEIRCRKKGRGGIASSPFKLRPGTILKVSFWIKAAGAEAGRVFLNFEGTPGDGWDKLDLPGGTYDWRQVTKRCVVPVRHERADGQTLMIFIYSKAAGSVWIDDVRVEAVDVNEMAEAPDRPALAPPEPKPIPEPPGSIGYRLDAASCLEKVFPDTDYAAAPRPAAALSMAANEREAVQVVVEAPWRDVTVWRVDLSALRAPSGAVIPAGDPRPAQPHPRDGHAACRQHDPAGLAEGPRRRSPHDAVDRRAPSGRGRRGAGDDSQGQEQDGPPGDRDDGCGRVRLHRNGRRPHQGRDQAGEAERRALTAFVRSAEAAERDAHKVSRNLLRVFVAVQGRQ